MNYYLAVDIGASSGRHILSHLENGKIVLEEIYRFENGIKEVDGFKTWDASELFQHILTGMKKCKEIGKIPVSMGIDTWAVDFVLLDKEDNPIGPVVAYRDGRTKDMDKEVYKLISEEDLYHRTGIQKQLFNTIYQLMAIKVKQPKMLDEAEHMLMIPDYFHYKLTGQKIQEYTNATTTQLVNPQTKNWDYELIDLLGYPRKIFKKIVMPGYKLGKITEDIEKVVGFSTTVCVPATHDTASAVMAVPTTEGETIYISSGTWSLMGTELKEAITDSNSKERNFTNEGGYEHRFRYLKNIMGMWMINSMKKEIANGMSFSEICRQASLSDIKSIVPVNDDRFLAPSSMTDEVKAACRESGQEVPETVGQIAAVIYNSLAKCYADTANELEEITGKKYDSIHIVGGGSKADYLNELTAKASKRKIYTGPIEATAIGNIVAQMIAEVDIVDLQTARECILHSFEIDIFTA